MKDLPYSPIRRVGNWYYVSGQIGKNMKTNKAEASIKSQIEQTLTNLKDALALVGLKPEHVVKTTIFLTDMDNFGTVNEVYGNFFAKPYPSRSTVAVKELPRVADNPMLVEIEAVAYKDN